MTVHGRITLGQWSEDSRQGKRCGLVGCKAEPGELKKCSLNGCEHHYCNKCWDKYHQFVPHTTKQEQKP